MNPYRSKLASLGALGVFNFASAFIALRGNSLNNRDPDAMAVLCLQKTLTISPKVSIAYVNLYSISVQCNFHR